MKGFASLLTIIALIGFLISSNQLSNDPISGSTKEGIHVFNFLVWFTIPGILWIIYFMGKQFKSVSFEKNRSTIHTNKVYPSAEEFSKNSVNTIDDNEIQMLNQKIFDFSRKLDQLKRDGDLLNRSLDQKLIDEKKYTLEMDKLDNEFYSIHKKKTDLEKRLTAIKFLANELRDLEDLCRKGIISVYAKESKRSELIQRQVQRIT